MLNFAEQTGSGAVMLVWSFPKENQKKYIINNEIIILLHTYSLFYFINTMYSYLAYYSNNKEMKVMVWCFSNELRILIIKL